MMRPRHRANMGDLAQGGSMETMRELLSEKEILRRSSG
jgi:hypothetical protein